VPTMRHLPTFSQALMGDDTHVVSEVGVGEGQDHRHPRGYQRAGRRRQGHRCGDHSAVSSHHQQSAVSISISISISISSITCRRCWSC
jgi:hypothetical protein